MRGSMSEARRSAISAAPGMVGKVPSGRTGRGSSRASGRCYPARPATLQDSSDLPDGPIQVVVDHDGVEVGPPAPPRRRPGPGAARASAGSRPGRARAGAGAAPHARAASRTPATPPGSASRTASAPWTSTSRRTSSPAARCSSTGRPGRALQVAVDVERLEEAAPRRGGAELLAGHEPVVAPVDLARRGAAGSLADTENQRLGSRSRRRRDDRALARARRARDDDSTRSVRSGRSAASSFLRWFVAQPAQAPALADVELSISRRAPTLPTPGIDSSMLTTFSLRERLVVVAFLEELLERRARRP